MRSYKITVIGAGYVGFSLGILLAKNNEVKFFDINHNKIDLINSGISPIKDDLINDYLKNNNLQFSATSNSQEAYENAEFIIVAIPTDFENYIHFMNTSFIDSLIEDVLATNHDCFIVIKSTVPIGYTSKINEIHDTDRIFFSPEFLREGKALNDNLYPSRIIMGSNHKKAKVFAKLLLDCSLNKSTKILFMNSDEAESVKLFSNSYLAMRVAFFNELDTFALKKSLNTKNIIEGVCLDERISDNYNNPSFGYGGYCLPKDSKQLLSNFQKIPQSLIEAIVSSNEKRKNFIAETISQLKPKTVGIYRLIMKANSNNFRSSAIIDIMTKLKNSDIEIIIYEPILEVRSYLGIKVLNDLSSFKSLSKVIVTNRMHDDLNDFDGKVFCRDIFNIN